MSKSRHVLEEAVIDLAELGIDLRQLPSESDMCMQKREMFRQMFPPTEHDYCVRQLASHQ